MTRLLIHVEGETEELFVNEVLAPHLYSAGYSAVDARLLGNSRLRARRGGICSWQVASRDIARHLKEDTHAYATTIVDFYALPQTGASAWPGRSSCGSLPVNDKYAHICELLLQDFSTKNGENIANRFIPYIAMHEFEGLLFSNPTAMASGMERNDLKADFEIIRNSFQTPEDINDSPETAPSKRIIKLIPGYQKPLLGTLAALEISIETMIEECPCFSSWIACLKSVTSSVR